MQNCGNRQVLAPYRAIDNGTQATHRSKCIDGAPVAAGPIVVDD